MTTGHNMYVYVEENVVPFLIKGPEERSLVTVAALTAMGNPDQLSFHLELAMQNGNSEEELIEAITHLAFYAGWPKAMSAMAVAKRVFRPETH